MLFGSLQPSQRYEIEDVEGQFFVGLKTISLARFNRSGRIVAPLCPGAIVGSNVEAQYLANEISETRAMMGLAMGNDRFVAADTM